MSLVSQFEPEDFFAGIATHIQLQLPTPRFLIQQWRQCDQGIIIAGLAQLTPSIVMQIAQLSKTLKWPVLADIGE